MAQTVIASLFVLFIAGGVCIPLVMLWRRLKPDWQLPRLMGNSELLGWRKLRAGEPPAAWLLDLVPERHLSRALVYMGAAGRQYLVEIPTVENQYISLFAECDVLLDTALIFRVNAKDAEDFELDRDVRVRQGLPAELERLVAVYARNLISGTEQRSDDLLIIGKLQDGVLRMMHQLERISGGNLERINLIHAVFGEGCLRFTFHRKLNYRFMDELRVIQQTAHELLDDALAA